MKTRSAEKTLLTFYYTDWHWLVYRDPCNGLLYFLYTWIVYLPYCTAILQQFLVIAHRSTKKEHSTLRLALALGSRLQKGAWDWWVKTDSEKIQKKTPGTDPPHTPKSRKKIDMLQKKRVLKGPRVCSRGMLDCLREAQRFTNSFQKSCMSFIPNLAHLFNKNEKPGPQHQDLVSPNETRNGKKQLNRILPRKAELFKTHCVSMFFGSTSPQPRLHRWRFRIGFFRLPRNVSVRHPGGWRGDSSSWRPGG